jgi:hypothetical protein
MFVPEFYTDDVYCEHTFVRHTVGLMMARTLNHDES